MSFDVAFDFRSILLEFFENVKLLRGSDKRRFIQISNRDFADRYSAHSCLGILKNKPQIMAPRVTPLEGVSTYALRGLGVRGVENPQGFGIDERRFVNLNIQPFSEVYQRNSPIKSPQSTQRAQSSAIPVTTYEKATPSRFRTRMTRIGRIFTDRRASASSAQSVVLPAIRKAV